jgi:hypothetical protein
VVVAVLFVSELPVSVTEPKLRIPAPAPAARPLLSAVSLPVGLTSAIRKPTVPAAPERVMRVLVARRRDEGRDDRQPVRAVRADGVARGEDVSAARREDDVCPARSVGVGDRQDQYVLVAGDGCLCSDGDGDRDAGRPDGRAASARIVRGKDGS